LKTVVVDARVRDAGFGGEVSIGGGWMDEKSKKMNDSNGLV
jgi:hypothetical protein